MSEYENFSGEFEKLALKMPNLQGYGPFLAFTGGASLLGMGLATADPKWKKLSPKQKRKSLLTHGLSYGAMGTLAAPKGSLYRRWAQGAARRSGQGGYSGYQRKARAPSGSTRRSAMETLNIPSGIKTKRQAKDLYRKQAMKYHPDRGGDPEKMKKVNKAWDNYTRSDHFQKLAFHAELEKIANFAGGGYFGSTPGMQQPGSMNPVNTARTASTNAVKLVQPRKPRMLAQKGLGAAAQRASAAALGQAAGQQPVKYAESKECSKCGKVVSNNVCPYRDKKCPIVKRASAPEAPISRGKGDQEAGGDEDSQTETNEGVRYDTNSHLAKQSSVRSARSRELLKIARGAHRANPIINLRKHHKNKKPSEVFGAMAKKSRK